MSDSVLGFRTISRAWVNRYVLEGTPPALKPIPISLPIAPDNADVNPGISQQKIAGKNMLGEGITELVYTQDASAEISLDFGVGTPEMESFVHSRLYAATTEEQGFVYFETLATAATIVARPEGYYGYSVTAQTAATSKAIVYYIDPETKLSVPLVLADSAPTGTQIKIGEHLALTLGPDLVVRGCKIYGWVPATFPKATRMTSETIGLCGVYMVGTHFDGTTRLFESRFCSPMFGGSMNGDPKRQLKFQVHPDPSDGTCLGWSMKLLPDKIAKCG